MKDGDVKILVLDRGFVLVGRVERHPDLAFHWRVAPARCVRRWGTTGGLAQLRSGKRPETQLDDVSAETVPFRAVLRILDVEEGAWDRELGLTSDFSSAPPRRTR